MKITFYIREYKRKRENRRCNYSCFFQLPNIITQILNWNQERIELAFFQIPVHTFTYKAGLSLREMYFFVSAFLIVFQKYLPDIKFKYPPQIGVTHMTLIILGLLDWEGKPVNIRGRASWRVRGREREKISNCKSFSLKLFYFCKIECKNYNCNILAYSTWECF